MEKCSTQNENPCVTPKAGRLAIYSMNTSVIGQSSVIRQHYSYTKRRFVSSGERSEWFRVNAPPPQTQACLLLRNALRAGRLGFIVWVGLQSLPWLQPCSGGTGASRSSLAMGAAPSHPLPRKRGWPVWAGVRPPLTQSICLPHEPRQLFQPAKLILLRLFFWDDFHSLGVQEQGAGTELPALCYPGVVCAVRPRFSRRSRHEWKEAP